MLKEGKRNTRWKQEKKIHVQHWHNARRALVEGAGAMKNMLMRMNSLSVVIYKLKVNKKITTILTLK